MKNKTVKLKNPNILTNVKRSKTSQGNIGLKKYTPSISEKGQRHTSAGSKRES
jgi:hypothetical protein